MAIRLFGASDNHLRTSLSAEGLVSGDANQTGMAWLWMVNYTVVNCMCGLYSFPEGAAIQFGSYGVPDFRVWLWGGASLVNITTGLPPTNTWFHAAFTRSGTTNSLYINGELRATTTTTPQTDKFRQALMNGYPTGGASETNNGRVFDMRWYNRALSQPEIETIFNLRGRDNIVFGMIGRWGAKMEGTVSAAVSQLVDLSDNTNNMTQIGTGSNPLEYIEDPFNTDTIYNIE